MTWKLTRDVRAKLKVGEIDIDSELVAGTQKLDGTDASTVMMLNNGCLCCTVRDDLIVALTALVRCLGSSNSAHPHNSVRKVLSPCTHMHLLHLWHARNNGPFDAQDRIFCPFWTVIDVFVSSSIHATKTIVYRT